jgi:hypothetical protein
MESSRDSIMEKNKEKIQIDVVRTGGLKGQKQILKKGLMKSKKDWNNLKQMQIRALQKVRAMPDTYIYKLLFENNEVIFPEYIIPREWKKRFRKIDEELDRY